MLWGLMKEATSRNGFVRGVLMKFTVGVTIPASIPPSPMFAVVWNPCTALLVTENGMCHLPM